MYDLIVTKEEYVIYTESIRDFKSCAQIFNFKIKHLVTL